MRWKKNREPVPAPDPAVDVYAELAAAVEAVYSAAGDRAALKAATDRFVRRLKGLPTDDPNYGLYLGVAGTAFADLFRLTGRIGDLRTAISFSERAAAAIPTDDPQRHKVLDHLGARFMELYVESHELADLDAGIAYLRRALTAPAGSGRSQAARLSNLGLASEWRWQFTAAEADRDSLIEAYEQALAEPGGELQRDAVASSLRTAYLDRYTRSGARDDLDTAITHGEAALVEGETEASVLVTRLFLLAVAYRERFDLAGSLTDVDRMIDAVEQALAIGDVRDPGRPNALALAAEGYRRRFDRTGAGADLDSGIERLEQAIAALPVDHPQRARWQSNVGVDQLSRFQLTGDPEALRVAIELGEQARAAIPPEDPDHGTCLGNLAMAYHARYGSTGDVADLDLGIDLDQRALALLTTDGHGRAAVLANVAIGCLDRYTRTGARDDVDAAVEHGEQALILLGPDGADSSACLSTLGSAYRRRHERYGASADLDAAVSRHEQAVRALPTGHPQRPQRLINLAVAYADRFDATGASGDLHIAIARGEEAAMGPFLKYDDRALALADLSGHYLKRFEEDGDPADLELSIQRGEQSAAAFPATHPRRAGLSAALAGAYLRRYQQAGTTIDLDSAIRLSEQALADEPGDMFLLSNLAIAYRARAAQQTLPAGTVSRLVEAASGTTTAGPTERGAAQTNVGLLALETGALPEAAAMFRLAVEALAQSATRGLDWADQERRLAGGRGLVGDAVATHLAIGDLHGAIELAELGRGILLSNRWDIRTDIDALTAAAPDLAAEFDDLRHELDARPPADLEGSPATAMAAWQARRHDLGDSWEALLRRIRDVPGLAGFLARPRVAELRQAAADGPVVLINVGRSGGDAIVLRTDSIDRVRLPHLTSEEVRSRASVLAGVELRAGSAWITTPTGATEELLAWIWQTITGPVLAALGYDDPPPAGSPLPRVWWVPTGAISLLPLHAAGLPGGGPSALDRVVSSYAPTVGILLHGRKRGPVGPRRQLTVAMRHTPGLPELPGTVAEATHLRARYPDAVQLNDARATAEAVLAALPHASWAHFACHAASHPVTPSRSGLHLHDGVLSLPKIGRLRIEGELAYLSACSTGQGSLLQADEVMHLTSAFQLAGYRHAVGALWPVDDAIAARAARRFYRKLGDRPTADQAAAALNEVTRELRDISPADPGLWAPFIHSGP